MKFNNKGHLIISGCDVFEIVNEFGTPIFIVDRDAIKNNINNLRSCLERNFINFEVYYSFKTNCIPAVLKLILNEGLGAEVISPYELWLALKLGVKPDKIIYNGVNKDEEGLKIAISKKINTINIDSLSELDKVIRLAYELNENVNIGLRIKMPSLLEAQFGLDITNDKTLALVCEKIKKYDRIILKGISFHVGTGIIKSHLYIEAIKRAMRIAFLIKKLISIELQYLDLGGGYGIPGMEVFTGINSLLYTFFRYIPPWTYKSNISIDSFFSDICHCLDRECKRHDLSKPKLILEPGRMITGNSQLLILKVIDLKKNKNEIAVLDGGLFNIALPVFFENHELILINRCNSRRTRKYTITGNTCATLDTYWRNKRFSELQIGDLVGISNAGAYFVSFSNNFCYPRPPIVMIYNGSYELIRERETYEDLIKRDIY